MNREVDAAPCEAKRAKQAKLRAAVKEKRARARDTAKAKATMLECATFATCFAKTKTHMVWVCALAIHVRGAYSAVAWRVAKNGPSPPPLPCKPRTQCNVLGSDDKLANVAWPRREARSSWWHALAPRARSCAKTHGTRGRPDFQAGTKQYRLERQSRSADCLRAVAMISAAQGAWAFGVTRVGNIWRNQ